MSLIAKSINLESFVSSAIVGVPC